MGKVFRDSLLMLRRFPQLLVFPAVCWLAQVLFQLVTAGPASLLTNAPGLVLRATAGEGLPPGFNPATFGPGLMLSIPWGLIFGMMLVGLLAVVAAAYLNAGQVQGVLLAQEGTPLTWALFWQACRRYGGRLIGGLFLSVLIAIPLLLVVGFVAMAMSIVGMIGLALVALMHTAMTAFWDIFIVRDDISVGQGLRAAWAFTKSNFRSILGATLLCLVVLIVFGLITSPLLLVPGLSLVIIGVQTVLLSAWAYTLPITFLAARAKPATPPATNPLPPVEPTPAA